MSIQHRWLRHALRPFAAALLGVPAAHGATIAVAATRQAVVLESQDLIFRNGFDDCDPSTSPTPVADTCGVFVDATNGNDANLPSCKAHPLATLAAAIAQVPSGGFIYACAGSPFTGGVTVPPGSRIYGGPNCAT
jgi:hypothetical protein